jgi:hypothetical protein
LFLALRACAGIAAVKPEMTVRLPRGVLERGEEAVAEIRVRRAPPVYGVDLQIAFDSQMIEVLDADERKKGVQITPGKFLDSRGAFFLENAADNRNGEVRYAMTRLNPEPPARGAGIVARIAFRARKRGVPAFRIRRGKFGTRAGETIAVRVEKDGSRSGEKRQKSETGPRPAPPRRLLFGIAAGLSAVFGGAMLLHWRERITGSTEP